MDRKIVCTRLAQQVTGLVKQGNMTPVPGITLFYAKNGWVRQPVMYKPAIVIVLQGEKTGYLGQSVFHYDASKYLMLTLPLPFECKTFATAERPLAGLSLRVDALQLQDLLIDIGEDDGFHPQPLNHGIHSAQLTEEMLCATERLLDTMAHPRAWAEYRARNSLPCAARPVRWGAAGFGKLSDAVQPDCPRAAAH